MNESNLFLSFGVLLGTTQLFPRHKEIQRTLHYLILLDLDYTHNRNFAL